MGNPIRPELTNQMTLTPTLHRVLDPEEFEQMQQVSPRALNEPWPTLPPVPKAQNDAMPGSRQQFNPQASRLSTFSNPQPGANFGEKLAGSALSYVANPMLEHPLQTMLMGAAGATPPGAVAFGLLGLKDLGQYGMQKYRESGMSPEQRATAESDPNRVSGEAVAWNTMMLLSAPLLHLGAKFAGISGEASAAAADLREENLRTNQLMNTAQLTSGERTPMEQDLATQAQADRESLRAQARGDMEANRAAVRQEMEASRNAVKQFTGKLVDSWNTAFAPAARGADAMRAATIMRAATGESAREYEQATAHLDMFRRIIDPLPDADKLNFIDHIEGGEAQVDPVFQPAADAIRKTLDHAREQVQNLGTGKLQDFITNYFPHIWKDPDEATSIFGQIFGKRPMEGSKSFLKQRSIPTTKEGIAMGLEPVTTNPIDLTLMKIREMGRYVMAHSAMNEMHEGGLLHYVRAGEEAPDGYVRINDKVATVYGPRQGAVSLPEGSMKPGDEAMRGEEQLRSAALKMKDANGHTRIFEGPTHMHALEEASRAGVLPKNFDPGAFDERGVDEGFLSTHGKYYSRYGAEKFAPKDFNPEEGNFYAENADLGKAPQGEFIPGHTELNPEDVTVHGRRIMGEYYAPEAAAKIINNYLSPGLRGKMFYDLYRGLGSTLNQAQLGLSAFHLGFTSMDAAVSRFALGLEYITSGQPLKGVGKILTAPFAAMPGIAQGLGGDFINWLGRTKFAERTGLLQDQAPIQMGLGAKIREAYLHPDQASEEMRTLANAVQEAGGRITQDSFYKNSAPQKLIQAWKDEEYWKVPGLAFPAFIEAAASPLMDHVVPLQKLQVFGELAQKVLGDLPDGAPLEMRRAALANAWDSVDNRMGQLVYDNLFWNKTFKDLSMASVRSVGWNLGTIRELGGGVKDLAGMPLDALKGEHVELSHRAAYVMSLPFVVGMAGATYQLLRTGEWPHELKDYFFPRTGEIDANGDPERVQLASYMRDMFAYAGHPWDTVKHKLNPILSATTQMLNNEDYYGNEIRNPDDPWTQQALQNARYVAGQFAPMSLKNMEESEQRGDQSAWTKAGSWFGITPARREDVRTDDENLMMHYLESRHSTGATPEDIDARSDRAKLLAAMRGNSNIDLEKEMTDAIEKHGVTTADVAKLLKRAGSTPDQEEFKRLTLPQAMEVYKKAGEVGTPDPKTGRTPHQEKFLELLLNKIERDQKKHAED